MNRKDIDTSQQNHSESNKVQFPSFYCKEFSCCALQRCPLFTGGGGLDLVFGLLLSFRQLQRWLESCGAECSYAQGLPCVCVGGGGG